jgi:hypothetical protein
MVELLEVDKFEFEKPKSKNNMLSKYSALTKKKKNPRY